jgi:hypothetical protein
VVEVAAVELVAAAEVVVLPSPAEVVDSDAVSSSELQPATRAPNPMAATADLDSRVRGVGRDIGVLRGVTPGTTARLTLPSRVGKPCPLVASHYQ